MKMKYQNIEFSRKIWEDGRRILFSYGTAYRDIETVRDWWKVEPNGGWIHGNNTRIRWSTEELFRLYRPFKIPENDF